MRTSSPLRVLLTALVGAAMLAGCGVGAGDDPSATATSPSESTPAETATTAATTPGATPEPEEPTGPQVAPADLANFSCARKDGGRWLAQGDVTNSASEPMAYTVTVVTLDGRDRVVGERIKTFELEPDESHRFRWPGFFRGAAQSCMPHVAREPA